MISTTSSKQNTQRIHPHKFTMWVAMGSIIMMFAGLTSAYIVRQNMGNWLEFGLPLAFYYSTAAILMSSVTMHLALKQFKVRRMQQYRKLLLATAVLGILFAALQVVGFREMHAQGLKLVNQSNPSTSFLVIITGLHALHVLGGVIALITFVIKAWFSRVKSYSLTPVEILSTYWHFVDVLWIYLLLFFGLSR